MVTRLSEQLLDDALGRLHGWRSDGAELCCELAVGGEVRGRVAAELGTLAARTHHPIRLAATPGGVTVRLSSAEVGGVSEVDVALASRINDLFVTGTGATRGKGPPRRPHVARVTADAAAADGDEHEWWEDSDRLEPVMGVPAATSAVMPAPLPDTAAEEPEPGVEPEQELGAGHGLGWDVHHPGED